MASIDPPAPDAAPRSVGFLLSQLGFGSSRCFAEELKPLGIQPGEFALMRFVAASEGQSQQELAERLGVPPSRMVARVDALEEAGLMERRTDAADRRIRRLHITRKGGGVLDRAAQIAIDYEGRICAGLDEGEREQLIDLLQKIQPGLIELRGVHPGLGADSHGPEDRRAGAAGKRSAG
jgi:DNA-binding MarR family transcriptional regulator